MSLAARIGSSRPSSTALLAVARARATYDGRVSGCAAPDVGEVGPHGLDVTADDRAGQGGVAHREGVVEGRGEQRAQGGGGVGGAGVAEQLHRLRDEGDQVVGAVREAGVVERALVLGDPHQVAAQVGDEGLGERDGVRLVGGDAERAAAAGGAGRARCR